MAKNDSAFNPNDEWEYRQWKGNKLQELRYHRAICMLVSGVDIGEVAKELKVSKRTVERFFNSPEFNENFTKAIQVTFKSALSKAALYADRALELLTEIAEDINQPTKYRLQAISTLFEVSLNAGLANPGKSELVDDFKQQSQLITTYNAVKQFGVNSGLPMDAINLSNQRAIWNELYPDEPFPQEEEFRKYFRKYELGEGE